MTSTTTQPTAPGSHVGGSPYPELDEVFGRVRELDLEEHVAELEAFGYTIVPPHKVASPEVTERLRDAIVDIHRRRTGQDVADLDSAELPKLDSGASFITHHLVLLEDPVFEEVLLNPAVLTLARYLCGASAVLSDLVAQMRGQSDVPPLKLHIDSVGVAPPLPPYPLWCNVGWVITDYTPDTGPLAIVPGSHRFGRPPAPQEVDGFRDDAPITPIPVVAPAGSLVVWTGHTWHGVFPRRNPGIRLSLSISFIRHYLRPMVDYRDHITQEAVDRNPPDFARVLGLHHPFPLAMIDGQRAMYQDPKAAESLKLYSRSTSNQWA